MDPLALLSNLHGDGPATLQRLRRHGCDTLTCLVASEAEDLAPILGWEPVRTERFLREADVLMRRLGDGLLDVEEDAPEPIAPETRGVLHALGTEEDEAEPEPDTTVVFEERRAPVLTLRDKPPAEEDDEDEDDDEFAASYEPDQPEEEPALPDHVREEVLTRWRTLDATEPLPEADDTLVPHTPSEPLSAPGRPLAAAGIDGLDPVRIRKIQGAGITTVEELASADDMELHLATGLPFTVAGRLTFLARRAAAKSSPAPARAAGSEAAGPFA